MCSLRYIVLTVDGNLIGAHSFERIGGCFSVYGDFYHFNGVTSITSNDVWFDLLNVYLDALPNGERVYTLICEDIFVLTEGIRVSKLAQYFGVFPRHVLYTAKAELEIREMGCEGEFHIFSDYRISILDF